MENIDYKRLSGEWYLQMAKDPTVEVNEHACNHSLWAVEDDGTWTAAEEFRFKGET